MENKKSLKQIISERNVEAAIAAKLASGRFSDTGKKYDASEAVADASNSALRMTATVNGNGKLEWTK